MTSFSTATTTARRPAAQFSAGVVIGLLLFGAMPLSFGVIRLLQFAGIVHIMPDVPNEFGLVAALLAHIVGAALYAVLGAFQFSAAIRRRWPAWHRTAGRIGLIGGLLVAFSALWLTFDYASMTFAGLLLVGFRVLFVSGLLLSIVMGFAAIRRRDIQHHRRWMIRAYALALGAATQMIVLMLGEMAAGGPLTERARALLMGLSWSINLGAAEWIIRRPATAQLSKATRKPT